MVDVKVKRSKVTKKTTKEGKKGAMRKGRVKRGPYENREYSLLRYVDNDTLVSATAQYQTGAVEGYMLNSIVAPNNTQIVGDKLPQGFANFNNIFGKYKVRHCKVKLEIAPNNTGKSCQLVIALNSAQDLASNIYPVASNTLDFSGTSQRRNVWTYNLPTDKKFVFKKYVKIYYLQSLTKSQFDNSIDDYSGIMTTVLGAAGSVPEKRCDIRFSIVNNTDATAVTILYEMELHYYTEFYDRTRVAFAVST